MANELKHATVGTQLTQAEWEAIGAHVLDGQATGDVIYASSSTQLSRLGIGTAGQLLGVSSGLPAWLTTLPGAYIFSGGPSFSRATSPVATFSQTQDAASVQVAIFEGDRATPGANDEVYIDLRLSDSAGNQDAMVRLTAVATDVTSTSEDAQFNLSLMVAGVLTNTLQHSNALLILQAAATSQVLRLRHSQGTVAAPTATVNGNEMFRFEGYGYGTSYGIGASIVMVAIETWTASAHGTKLEISTVTGGGTADVTRIRFENATIQFQGGARLLSMSATEIGIQVSNGSLTVGSEGSLEAPYLSQTGAAFTDAIGGDLNGCIGVNYDSDTGPTSTLEVRVEGAWLSVALAGYLIQSRTFGGGAGSWHHPNQIRADKMVDETVCVVCGESLNPSEQITLWANYQVTKEYPERQDLHAVFGHLHPERDAYIRRLEYRVLQLEQERTAA